MTPGKMGCVWVCGPVHSMVRTTLVMCFLMAFNAPHKPSSGSDVIQVEAILPWASFAFTLAGSSIPSGWNASMLGSSLCRAR